MKKQKAKFTDVNKKSLLIFSIVIYFLFLVIYAILFRKLRDTFSVTIITPTKIVGFSQYFGYPFYLETISYWIFIFLPFVIMAVVRFVYRGKRI